LEHLPVELPAPAQQVGQEAAAPQWRRGVAYELHGAVRRPGPGSHAAMEVEEVGQVRLRGLLLLDERLDLGAHEPLTFGPEDLRAARPAPDEAAIEQLRVASRAVVRPRDLAALAAVPQRQRSRAGAERKAGGVGRSGGMRSTPSQTGSPDSDQPPPRSDASTSRRIEDEPRSTAALFETAVPLRYTGYAPSASAKTVTSSSTTRTPT